MEAYSKTLEKDKKTQKNSGEQAKDVWGKDRINLSLGITICHHSGSLVMPNADPRDGFF